MTEVERIAQRLQAAGKTNEAAALRVVAALYDGLKLADLIALAGIISEDEPDLTKRVARGEDLKRVFAQAAEGLQKPPEDLRLLLRDAITQGATAGAEMLAVQAAAPEYFDAFRLRPDAELRFLNHTTNRLVEFWGVEQVDLANYVQSTLIDALEKGQGRQQIAARLREQVEFSRNRASLIARNELGNAASYAMKETQTQAGVTEYEWWTARDDRVRGKPGGKYPKAKPSHWARHGKRFKWNDPPEGGHPGQAIQCRCAALAVLPENWRQIVTGQAQP